MADKTYIFTEEQLKRFLYRTIIGATEDEYLTTHKLAEEFLERFSIDLAYEETMQDILLSMEKIQS